MSQAESTKKAFEAAKEQYAVLGVDVENAMKQLDAFSISLHCWQADDVGGFETPDSSLKGGGIQATGNYPGKARNIEEHRLDLEKAMSLIPSPKTFRKNSKLSFRELKKNTPKTQKNSLFQSLIE